MFCMKGGFNCFTVLKISMPRNLWRATSIVHLLTSRVIRHTNWYDHYREILERVLITFQFSVMISKMIDTTPKDSN